MILSELLCTFNTFTTHCSATKTPTPLLFPDQKSLNLLYLPFLCGSGRYDTWPPAQDKRLFVSEINVSTPLETLSSVFLFKEPTLNLLKLLVDLPIWLNCAFLDLEEARPVDSLRVLLKLQAIPYLFL